MKKFLLISLFLFGFFLSIPSSNLFLLAHATGLPSTSTITPTAPATQQIASGSANTPQPADGGMKMQAPGSWLSDDEVTSVGKNAARARDMFNWVLKNYQWSTDDHTLVDFWTKIRNVVYVFLVLLVMITAFIIIITGGRSFTAIQFIRKFLLVIVLIGFSFALVRIFYQIVDIIQLFFIKTPEGAIISSADLLNIGFPYEKFFGFRRVGPVYNESASISLLLTRLTAATYFAMAGILIIRKVILWFFITVSPIYPVLFLYFPIKNTAKIWIGEFFRWLLYAPLFAIFLSGLVVLWKKNLNVLPFNFDAVGAKATVVYPTAINIILGAPGQVVGLENNVNYTDTFTEYVVALIMLWVVIFLPFLLLRVFFDYFASGAMNNNPAWKYIVSNANKILPSNDFLSNKNQSTPPPTAPKPPSFYPTGMARQLPFAGTQAKAMNIPQSIKQATTINQVKTINNAQSYQSRQQTIQNVTSKVTTTPVYKSQSTSATTSQLVNFPIPTMRDVAKYETSRMNSQSSTRQETSKVSETLQKIANPQSISNPIERQQFSQIREKLTQAQNKGEPLAASILHAANTVTRTSQTSNTATASSVSEATTQLQKMANPQSISSTTERQQVTSLKEKLTEQSKQGNSYATTILNTVSNISSQNSQQTNSQVQQVVEKLANPQSITNVTERQQITQLKETLTEEKQKGNPIATSILHAVTTVSNTSQTTNLAQVTQQATTQVQQTLQKLSNSTTITSTVEKQQYSELNEKLTQQSKQGDSYATTILNIAKNISSSNSTENQKTVQETIEKIAHPESITNPAEKQSFMQMKDRLITESQHGDVVAQTVLSAVNSVEQAKQQGQIALLPQVNQVQTVNLEDYEEVKKTWTENYQKLPVPKSLDNPDLTRTQWIQKDLANTTHAIDLLSSQDSQKVKEGMSEVSSLLPFLLVGGFSQTEIVSYLQAKKHAAEATIKSTSQQAQQEEDTLLETTTKHAQATRHMEQSITNNTINTINSIQQETINNNEDNPIYQAMHSVVAPVQSMPTNPVIKGVASMQTMQLVNFSIPTMRTVTQFETAKLRQDNTMHVQVEQMHGMLQKLANPEFISDQQERQTYVEMKNQLKQAQLQGDPLATSILSTAQQMTQSGNTSAVALPNENQVQTVNLEDYEEVRKTWKDNYEKLPVPKAINNTDQNRETWIKEDIAKTASVVDLLTSSDPAKKKQGMELVAELLPFLLLGGFSETEVISYLQAKKHAGEEVLKGKKEKESEEETLLDAKEENKGSETEKKEEQVVTE